MARPLRIERAGGWYHVTSRGNERKAIFRDDRDRRHFLELMGEVVDRFRIRLHVYVLKELRELAEAVELRNDAVVATNAIRYEKRRKESRAEQAAVRKVLELLNCKI